LMISAASAMVGKPSLANAEVFAVI
jgi:hypothetical protein